MTRGWRRFAFRLALALGQPNVDAMLDAMPAWMLEEWAAFDAVEPVSAGYRGDVQAALISSTLANLLAGGRRAYALDDFMLRWEPRQSNQTPDETWRLLKTWAQLNARSKP